jgi:DNA-directed RNA polymerase subunit RPC12/RpoP
MTIQFLCPNGHQIRCPDEQAGRAAKCPKCGAKFRVPDLSETEGPAIETELPSEPEEVEEEPGAGDEGQIEFLCPNGHRLNGPASLQGRPGQCPECGSRFRIPSYEDVPEEEATDQEQIGIGRVDGTTGSGLRLEELGEGSGRAGLTLDLNEGDETPAAGSDHPSAASGIGSFFCRIWAARAKEGSVELHLVDGETVTPDRFDESLSRGSHGLFALDEPDGSYTLVAVAWASVARIVVRGVDQLPPGMRQ